MNQTAANLITDGDAAFLRVNNRLPAHALKPGEVAEATNIRFDEGKPRPRLGVALEEWGTPLTNLVTFGQTWPSVPIGSLPSVTLTLVVGQKYLFIQGNADLLTSDFVSTVSPPSTLPGTTTIDPGVFTATQTTYYLWAASRTDSGTTVTGAVYKVQPTCGYKRFNDPLGVDNAVLLTSDWRDGNGEDGGRGRAWRICPGNVPQSISLNGHDVWGTCRLEQAHHTLVLARHGNERHYFKASAVDAGNNRITLNATPNWATGDLVLYQPEANSEIIPGPNPGAQYYVQNLGSNRVSLHGSAADAVANTNKIDLGTAAGKFYLERQATAPGPFGNGAWPLILQPTDTLTAFENGFRAVPTSVAITNTTDADETLVAPSHRLLVGDAIAVTLTTDTPGTKYARPLSDHVIKLYDTQAHALAGGATGLFDITTDGQTGTLAKTGASTQPMPPLRELAYHKGRIIGIVWGTKDTIVLSDPFDFLHFSLFTGTVVGNLGESGNANWLAELGEDALLIGKDLAVLVIAGLSGASSGWTMDVITREFGGIAPLGNTAAGADRWFLSRKGVASVTRTIAGEKLGEATPVSNDIPALFADIDWLNAYGACAEVWNNRFFLALPPKNQTVGDVRNTRTLVYNFLNQESRVDQQVIEDQIVGRVVDSGVPMDTWEGSWNGDLLQPYAFSKLKISGEERLTFATPDGLVCWFTDGFEDGPAPVETRMVTRGYFGGALVLALRGAVNWDTYNPNLDVTIRSVGYNEETALVEGRTFDRTQYLVDGQADYDPSSSTTEDFDVPHREDYSMTAEEVLVGVTDVHQNQTENLRMRVRDRAPQIIIENSQGSVRVNSVQLTAKLAGVRATRMT